MLARHEGDFRIDAEQSLSLNELLALLDDCAEGERPSRENAIACYLSRSEGWREAMRLLGGTFAKDAKDLRDSQFD